MLLFLLFFVAQPTSNQLILSDDQATYASLSLPESTPPEVETSMKRIRFYFKEVTGHELPILRDPKTDSPEQITIKYSIVGDATLPNTPFENQSFTIAIEPPGTILLSAQTTTGLDYAVSEFIERYLGVRWLMPSMVGTHIPHRPNLATPIETIEQEPAFWCRKISGLHHPQLTIWAKNLRISAKLPLPFNHNLNKLFKPENYIHSHPDFFPEINGIRHLPVNNTIYRWQPCFSALGLTAEAISNIASYFNQNPEESGYSLGINDSDKFCRCKKCAATYPKAKNRYGYLNASDIYYAWVNDVVEGVLQEYQNKWFGLLAYLNCGEPPKKGRLHPRVVPFITYDRSKWVVPKIKTQGHKITREYLQKSQYVGWYDYIYGCPYLLPRVYFHQMAQTYSWAAKQERIKFIYAEASPNFGEGPKLYIATKLFWDPNQDVDDLLEEWCQLAVGQEAADPLLNYYRHWEQFWTERIPNSDWVTEKGQWMWFGEPDYLKLVKEEEIKKSRSWLEEVREKASTTNQKARAEIIFKAFEYYEASAYSYWHFVEKRSESRLPLRFFEAMNKKRYNLVANFEKQPLLRHPTRFDRPHVANLSLLNWRPPPKAENSVQNDKSSSND